MGINQAPQTFKQTQDGSGGNGSRQTRRHGGNWRRSQLLRTAAVLFSRSGLNGTTTQALARAAGITEPVLYDHFKNKAEIFRESVERNIDARLRALDYRLGQLDDPRSLPELVEDLAKATVSVCVCPRTTAVLTNWALLEAPEYAVDLHRIEIGTVELAWEREVRRIVPASSPELRLLLPFIPQAVNASIAYGLWLAALRHTPATARELAGQFALALGETALRGPDADRFRPRRIDEVLHTEQDCIRILAAPQDRRLVYKAAGDPAGQSQRDV